MEIAGVDLDMASTVAFGLPKLRAGLNGNHQYWA
jgi:hypothetical protein